MNAPRLIPHVMRVDFRAQRGPLAVWGFVLLAQAAILVACPDRLDNTTARVNYEFGIAVVRFGWTIIVAALLVQSDVLVGTTAFWMTRPIPRAVLLTAKMLSAALWFVATPCAATAAVLLWLGMSPLDALAGGGMIGLEQAVILAMAVMAALVTANTGQIIVAGIAGVTLVAVFNSLLLPVLTMAWPSVGGTLSGGQPVVYASAVIIGGLVVAAYQYSTRRASHTVALVAAAMFVATAATRLWPAPPAVPDIGPVPESVMSTSAVSLTASSLAPRIEDTGIVIRGKLMTSKRVGVETRSAGHPPGIYFLPVAVATEIRFPTLSPIYWSGTSTQLAGKRAPRDDYEDQDWRSIRVALGDVDLATPGRLHSFTSIADIPEAEFHAHTFMPGRLKTDITMIAYRYEVTAAVPLRAGVTFNAAGRAARILSVISLNLGVRIGLRETSLTAPRRPGQSGSGTSWYVLRNTAQRSAVPLKWIPVNRGLGTVGISATGVRTMRGTLEVEIPPEFAQRFNLDAAWLDGAELVLVEPKPLGVLTRSLVIDNFILRGPPAGGASGQPDGGSSASPLTQAGKGGNPEPRSGYCPMRHIRHLVWFDVLALRVPLAAWAAFLLVEGTLFYFGPMETASLPDVGRLSATLGLAIVRMVATVVIIALLVHTDPTVGTTAFWRSRPISRLALLTSKLISALLWLVVLPGIVTTLVLLLLGMDLATASDGGSIVSCDQTVFVFTALALAIVTKDLVQVIVAAAIGIGILLAFNETLLPAALSTWPTLANALTYLPRVAVATVVIGLVGVVAIYQYLTLRIWHSIAILGCAIIIASVAPRLGARVSWGASTWPEPVPTGLIGPSDVVLSVVPGTQLDRQTSRGVNNKLTRMHELSFEVVTSGEPDAVRFTPLEVRSDLDFQDHSGATWTRRYPSFSSPASGTRTPVTVVDQPYRSIRQALGNPEFVIPESLTRTARRLAVVETTDEQFLRWRGQSARLDAKVTGLAYRYMEAAAMPLKAGSRMSIPNTGVVSVESVTRTATGMVVVLRETSLERYGGSWGLGAERSFLLRNATRRLVVYGAWAPRFRYASYTRGVVAANVVSTFSELSFSVPDAAAGGPLVDDEWMKSAELVRVDSKLLGTVTRPLRIENFVIGAGQK